MFIGGGDYQNHFNSSAKTTITLTPESDGSYALDTVGFGYANFSEYNEPASGYFQGLGYPDEPQSAIIATNFVGMGIPDYLWLQTINLLYKVDLSFNDKLKCDSTQGNGCFLTDVCSTFTGVWSSGWGFKVYFTTAPDDYVIIPLGALAVDNAVTGHCDIMIQYLNPDQHS